MYVVRMASWDLIAIVFVQCGLCAQGRHGVSCVIHFHVVSGLRIHISEWSRAVCKVGESVLGRPLH